MMALVAVEEVTLPSMFEDALGVFKVATWARKYLGILDSVLK